VAVLGDDDTVPSDAVIFRVGMPSPTAMLLGTDAFLARVIAEPTMSAAEVASLLGPDSDVLAQQLQTLFMDMLAIALRFYQKPASDALRDWSLSDLMLNARVATHRAEESKGQGLDDFTRRVGIER